MSDAYRLILRSSNHATSIISLTCWKQVAPNVVAVHNEYPFHLMHRRELQSATFLLHDCKLQRKCCREGGNQMCAIAIKKVTSRLMSWELSNFVKMKLRDSLITGNHIVSLEGQGSQVAIACRANLLVSFIHRNQIVQIPSDTLNRHLEYRVLQCGRLPRWLDTSGEATYQ